MADLDELTIDGFAGNDTIDAAAAGGPGTFRVVNLYGGLGNDSIKGSAGVDIMSGAEGNDLLDGQQGNDSAWLGVADTFGTGPGRRLRPRRGPEGHRHAAVQRIRRGREHDGDAQRARFTFFRNLATSRWTWARPRTSTCAGERRRRHDPGRGILPGRACDCVRRRRRRERHAGSDRRRGRGGDEPERGERSPVNQAWVSKG